MAPLQLIKKYVWNVLIAIDQLGNALTGGDPDETISSRTAKLRDRWPWKYLGWLLEKIDPGHLDKSLECDEGQADLFYNLGGGDQCNRKM